MNLIETLIGFYTVNSEAINAAVYDSIKPIKEDAQIITSAVKFLVLSQYSHDLYFCEMFIILSLKDWF